MRINMSKEKPMVSAAKEPQVRYSAAYPTGRERFSNEVEKVGGGGRWIFSFLNEVEIIGQGRQPPPPPTFSTFSLHLHLPPPPVFPKCPVMKG